VGDQVAPGIRDSYIHWLPYLLCFRFRRGYDSAGIFELDHCFLRNSIECPTTILQKIIDWQIQQINSKKLGNGRVPCGFPTALLDLHRPKILMSCCFPKGSVPLFLLET
jgi:hypothetical protein